MNIELSKLTKDYENYLRNERKYPENTITSYIRDITNYQIYITENLINFKK